MYVVYILLSLYIQAWRGPSTGAAAQAVPSAQLLPDGFSAFGNFEVLSVREESDEDVVRIRKRADDPEDCDENDCLTYSGWAEEGKVGNSFEDPITGYFADPDVVPGKRSELEERDGFLEERDGFLKERDGLEERAEPKQGVPLCKDIMFDGKPAPGIPIYSLEWPTPSSKIDVRTSSTFINSGL
jgi:hypothetical protein